MFGITTPINGEPATHGNGSTIGFTAQSLEKSHYPTHRNVRFNLRRPSSACSPSASALTPW